jgi:succinyl-CoA synthetase beta subunit
MLEINPLIQTAGGDFICLDAKVAVDDNALFRQRDAFRFLDYDEIDEREITAAELGISYVALSGNIGCMVNGAGLAMATMDMIKRAGGEPANFLDVGGGATKEMVTEACKLILRDSSVKGILVNIFGGIMRCDVIAGGIIEAAKALDIKVPLVVRLKGTNVEIGKDMLAKSGLKITPADDMADAAQKIVQAVK